MSVKNILKLAPLALAAAAFNSHAGVTATSYLEVNNLFVELDTDGDLVADPVNPLSIISILDATREGNTSVNFNALSDGSTSVDNTGVGTSDALATCVGPDCAALTAGITDVSNDDTRSLDLGNLIHSDAMDYSYGDMNVEGNAIGGGASGYTYADVGISGPSAIASSSTQIFNNLLTTLTIDVTADINLRFTAVFDLFVDAIISADLASDGASNATASAEASLSFILKDITNPNVELLNDGISSSDFAFDVPGLGNQFVDSRNDENFESEWVNLTAGTYQLQIAQDSDVQASILPEPGSLAMLGLGLLGLGLRQRRKG